MSHKTKAAKTGRHCYYSEGSSAVQGILTFVCSSCIRKHHRKLFAAGGQSLSAPVIKGTAALAHTPFPQIWGEQDQRAGCTAMQHTPEKCRSLDCHPDIGYQILSNFSLADVIQLFGAEFNLFSHVCRSRSFSSFPHATDEVLQERKKKNAATAISRMSNPFLKLSIAHSLGSIPRCCNSLRMMRLIQAARDSSPSCCWACSISARNSGSSLNWNGGLPRLSFLCVDTSITPDVMCLCVMTHYIHKLQIATPRSAGTLPRRLTKTLSEVTTMAELQSTQTRTEFTWRFISASERYPTAKPLVIYVNASSEQEARDTMPGVNLIFAARLPFLAFQAMEVRHA